MRYADKLFGVFQRLHRREDFEDKGATFYFTLDPPAEPPTDPPREETAVLAGAR